MRVKPWNKGESQRAYWLQTCFGDWGWPQVDTVLLQLRLEILGFAPADAAALAGGA